jgi:NTE family protein
MSNEAENTTAKSVRDQGGDDRNRSGRRDKRGGEEVVGLVISGAGARGAYEAGALDVLLPALAEQKQRPKVLIGTSAGAINAALLAQYADLKAEEATGKLLDTWRNSLTTKSVWRPFFYRTAPINALRYLARFAGFDTPVTGILDTDPARKTGQRVFEPKRFRRNVEAGHVHAVAAVATLCPPDGSGGRTRVFVQSRHPLPGQKPGEKSVQCQDDGLDFFATPLGVEHVMASASIPVLFPPTKVTAPAGAAGWYVDGGVRLNTPIKPALMLGADRLVVVSSHAVEYSPAPEDPAGPPPAFEDAAAVSLHALLADGVIEDLDNLRRINRVAKHLIEHGLENLQLGDRDPYRVVPYLAFGPADRELATIAYEIFQSNYRRLPRSVGDLLNSIDYRLLARLLAGNGESPGDRELLSYLLFDRDYFEEQFALGRRDARGQLERGWKTTV